MYVISIKNGKVESMLQKGERKNDDKVGLSFLPETKNIEDAKSLF